MQQEKLEDNNQLEEILERLESLEQRQKKIEAQQTKILRLQTKGRTYSEEEKEEQLMIKLAQKVTQSPKGVNTKQVESLFNCSTPTATKKMREIDEDSEKIDYVKGSGRKPDRLVHKRFGIGRLC